MGNSSWDTYEEPARRKMPLWGKLLIGCGGLIALLLCAGTCFAYWAAHSGKGTIKHFIAEKVDSFIEKPWGMLVDVVDAIQTDEGSRALYRDNPLLAADYTTEDEFLKNAAKWREKLVGFPRTIPSLDSLDQSDFRLVSNKNTGSGSKSPVASPSFDGVTTALDKKPSRAAKSLEIGYTLPNGSRINIAWEDDKLAEIEIK